MINHSTFWATVLLNRRSAPTKDFRGGVGRGSVVMTFRLVMPLDRVILPGRG